MAEDVLRLAGFIENVNYRKQTPVDGDSRAMPDFTFTMPKDHVLYMDVKFPLTSYLRYLEAGTDAERQAHLEAVPARRPAAGEGARQARVRRRERPGRRSTRCCCSCPTSR